MIKRHLIVLSVFAAIMIITLLVMFLRVINSDEQIKVNSLETTTESVFI